MYLIMYFDESATGQDKPITNVLNQTASISQARSLIREYAITHVRNECGIKQSEKAFVDGTEMEDLHDGLSLFKTADETEIEVWSKNTNIESSYYLFSSPITNKRRIGYFRYVYYEKPQQGDDGRNQESTPQMIQCHNNKKSENNGLRAELYKELSSVLSDVKNGRISLLRQTNYESYSSDDDEGEKDAIYYKMLRARATGNTYE